MLLPIKITTVVGWVMKRIAVDEHGTECWGCDREADMDYADDITVLIEGACSMNRMTKKTDRGN